MATKTMVLRRFKRFWIERRGASFVEFAIIAFPFFFIVFGIFEVGLVFWGSYELEDATVSAARLVRTGQAQNQNFDVAAFKTQVCSKVVLLSNCASKLQVDVKTFASFSAVTSPAAVDDHGKLRTDFNFDLGGPSQIVLITTFYEWPLTTFMTSSALANLSDGNLLMRAATAFRNEPFSQLQR